MSYKSDMERINRARRERRDRAILLLKISVIALAALILITVAVTAVTAMTGGFGNRPTVEEPQGGNDTKKPTLRGPEGDMVLAYIGEAIRYKEFVTVNDDSGKVKLTVDNSAVQDDKAGKYTVIYTATDPSGNSRRYELILVLRQRTVTDAELAKLRTDVAAKAQELGITADMPREQQVRKIYDFVNNWVRWGSDRSNIMDTHGASFTRDSWQVDWEEEAILALKTRGGDCYSYYSLSKAFFEVLGIENLGIRRSEASSERGTHFWNVVNVGTEAQPRWYYYDATELAGTFSDGTDYGCLMTEAKLKSYVTSKGGTQFYLFDKWEGFPTIEAQSIK